MKCGSCNEVSDKWIYITLSESNDVKGGRGTANLVFKCKLCSRENNMGIGKDHIQNKCFTLIRNETATA